MRDWKLSGTAQRQQNASNNNSVPMKSHGVTFSLISRYQNNKGDSRNGPEAPATSSMQHMSQACGGNRSRADSGTSTYSGSSCDGAETPLLAQQQKKTRKRSHRPRGCRGGSSRRGANRKTANSQLQQAQQQDNNGPSANGSHHLNTTLSDDVPVENMYPYQTYQQNQEQQPQSKLALLPRQQQQQAFPLPLGQSAQPTLESFNDRAPFGYTTGCNGSFPNGKPSQSMEQKKYVQDGSYGNFTANFNRSKPPQQTTKDPFDASDLNPFASTFDFLPPPSQEISFPFAETISASLSSSSSSSSEFILPPLPADALDEESPTILNGPNPYALNSFIHPSATSMAQSAATNAPSCLLSEQGTKWNKQLAGPELEYSRRALVSRDEVYGAGHEMHSEVHSKFSDQQPQPKPRVAPIVTYQSPENDFLASNDDAENDISPSESLDCDYSYRSARIERQRQMMAQGGSLFVTSPRSFLLGWRKTTTSAMAPVM